jgi:drug/metabolite transporter (DMT)-like permease
MATEIVIAVLVSAVLHAGWNAVMKGYEDKEAAWWMFGVVLCGWSFGHALYMGYDVLAVGAAWPLFAISAMGQLCYGFGLIGAYRRGDLSAYYPIIRSSPVVIVLINVVLFGVDYGVATLAGIGLVVAGAFLIQFRPGVRVFDHPAALAFALMALCGTGVYSLADSHAVKLVPPPVVFFWIEMLMAPIYMVMFRLVGYGAVERRAVAVLCARPVKMLGLGLVGYVSYFLILWAFSAGGDVAAVAALRQVSIPASVLLGGLWLRERHLPLRLVASVMLATGIVVIIVSG